MIISCPSCATRYDLPARQLAEGSLMRCSSCSHSWLEGRAIEVLPVAPRQVPAVIEHGPEPEHEIRRLVDASREAQETFAARRRMRRRKSVAWSAFAAFALAPVAVAGLFPELVVRAAPVTARAYEVIGQDVNIYGLELRQVEMQHMAVDGTTVLAIKGVIANTSGRDRKIPWLRFGLRDGTDGEVYSWTLDSGARPLHPGESTNFVTRVAKPPVSAKNLQIRFARAEELVSNAAP